MSYHNESVMVITCDHYKCKKRLVIANADDLEAQETAANDPPKGWTAKSEPYESYGWPDGPRTLHKLAHYCPSHG